MQTISNIVGGGYSEFFTFAGRYIVCKGSRASKKSKTAALWAVLHLLAYPQSCGLYVRKTANTLEHSCFADVKWAVSRLGLDDFFSFFSHPLKVVYNPTGQSIFFKGCDDPTKITSISAGSHVLDFAIFEEASEISKESDFDTINECLRGQMPEGYFKRVFVLFNPWSGKHWLKSRFFDTPDSDDKIALTRTYECNEFLDASDLQLFEEMKKNNPRRYKVAGLGEWGISEGLIYDKWIKSAFDVSALAKKDGVRACFGLDFGYTNSPSAFCCMLLDEVGKCIYIFDEFYKKGLTNQEIANLIIKKGYAKEVIFADAAEPKSIEELRRSGVYNIRAAQKGKDSINNGIQYIQNFQIVVHPNCVNFLSEISSYSWAKDKNGECTNVPEKEDDHLMDAMRYGLQPNKALSFL